jgi:hypothetical protein
MKIDTVKSVNNKKLWIIGKVIKGTMTHLINNNVDGLLQQPTDGNQIMEFSENMDDIIISKLKVKLGV